MKPLARPSVNGFSRAPYISSQTWTYMSILSFLVNRHGLVLKISALRPGPEWESETMALCLVSMCSKTTWNYWRRHWKNVLCILPHDFGKHNVVSERPLIHIWTAANESGVSMKMRRWKTILRKQQWSQRLFYDMPWPTLIQKQSLHPIRIFALWVEPLGRATMDCKITARAHSATTCETMCSALLITIFPVHPQYHIKFAFSGTITLQQNHNKIHNYCLW